MSSHRETLEYLYALNRHGIKLGLDPTITILKRLGNPHSRYVSLHIGGTNGKGSTAAMVAAVLQVAGYRVGLYTSPHLVEFRERIRVQGSAIPDARVVELTDRIRCAAGATLALTFFELTTAMAFQYFAEEHVDIAVIEVGMGGRFDATNVVDPLGVLITNIALDHEQYLGHTLPDIACEKAGIIKKGTSVILGPLADEARRVIEAYAADHGVVSCGYGTGFHVTPQTGMEFCYEGPHWSLSRLRCSLLGDHQILNAACALALLEVGVLKGMQVSESAVRRGLAEVRWEGRLELIDQCPQIWLDGAHNAAAAHVLAAFLSQKLRQSDHANLILVVGMMRDKNHRAFFEILTPLARHVVVTQASVSRKASVHELIAALPDTTCSVRAEACLPEAIKIARRLAAPTDLICITGSLIVVGEARDFLLRSDFSSSQV